METSGEKVVNATKVDEPLKAVPMELGRVDVPINPEDEAGPNDVCPGVVVLVANPLVVLVPKTVDLAVVVAISDVANSFHLD